MTRRLNFGAYGKGLTFEQYVLSALSRIEKWSYDVTTRHDLEVAFAVPTRAELETGSLLLLETGDKLIFGP